MTTLPMSVVIIHLALAIILFFVVNWIGEHSSSFGYLQLSILPRIDQAPAFNWMLRTMAPTVYIVLIATLCYVTRHETLVRGIWLVSVFYFPIRVLYNVALGRFLLLNWISIVGQTVLGISASYLAYVHLILPKTPLLPSAESVRDQLWIIIALFFYATFNNIRTSNASGLRRKNRYIESQFKELKQKYGSLVDGQYPMKTSPLCEPAVHPSFASALNCWR